jgi:hypothetical protein
MLNISRVIIDRNTAERRQFEKDMIAFGKLFNLIYEATGGKVVHSYFSDADINWIREVEKNVKLWCRDGIVEAVEKTLKQYRDRGERPNIMNPWEHFENA